MQIGHILLGTVLLASALLGGKDVEFALFDLQGETLSTLRASMLAAFVVSFVNAIVTYLEELIALYSLLKASVNGNYLYYIRICEIVIIIFHMMYCYVSFDTRPI